MIEIEAISQKQAVVARISDRLAQSDWNALETAVSQATCHFEAFDVRIELVWLDEEEAATLRRQLEFAGSYADRIQRLVIVANDDFWHRLSPFLTWPTDELLGIPVEHGFAEYGATPDR